MDRHLPWAEDLYRLVTMLQIHGIEQAYLVKTHDMLEVPTD